MKITFNKKNVILIVVLIFICFITLFGFALYRVSTVIYENKIKNELPRELNEKTVYLTNIIDRSFTVTKSMQNTSLIEFLKNSDIKDEELISILNDIKKRFDYSVVYFVSNETKKYFNDHKFVKVIRKDIPKDKWFFNFIETDKHSVLNLDIDEGSHNMTIFTDYKIFNENGEIIGVFGIGHYVNDLVKKVFKEDKFVNAPYEIWFVNYFGDVALSSKNEVVEIGKPYYYDKELNKEMFSKKNDGVYEIVRDGVPLVSIVKYLEQFDWSYVIEIPKSELIKESIKEGVIQISRESLIIFLIIILALLFMKKYFFLHKAMNSEEIEKKLLLRELEFKKDLTNELIKDIKKLFYSNDSLLTSTSLRNIISFDVINNVDTKCLKLEDQIDVITEIKNLIIKLTDFITSNKQLIFNIEDFLKVLNEQENSLTSIKRIKSIYPDNIEKLSTVIGDVLEVIHVIDGVINIIYTILTRCNKVEDLLVNNDKVGTNMLSALSLEDVVNDIYQISEDCLSKINYFISRIENKVLELSAYVAKKQLTISGNKELVLQNRQIVRMMIDISDNITELVKKIDTAPIDNTKNVTIISELIKKSREIVTNTERVIEGNESLLEEPV
jgi:methyl-accepting chemotaxis protein